MDKKTCPYCQYEWYSRLMDGRQPAECPSCKRYLVKKPKLNQVKKEEEKNG